MYCCFCAKQVTVTKLVNSQDKLNGTKRFQMACLQCDIHVNKIVNQNYSDKKALYELEKEFLESIEHLIEFELERGLYNG